MANVLGLDLGPASVRAVLLRTTMKKVEVDRYIEAAYENPANRRLPGRRRQSAVRTHAGRTTADRHDRGSGRERGKRRGRRRHGHLLHRRAPESSWQRHSPGPRRP